MQHQITRSAFGEILGHPSKPNLRFFMPPPEGEGGGGAGAGAGGGDAAAAAAATAAATAAAAAAAENQPLSAEDAKAIRKTADKAMQERNAARDEAKKFSDLGLTPEEIAQLKADRDAKNGGPTPEQIQKDADKRAEKAASEKFAAKARSSEIRTQAATLGFHDPAAALLLLNPDEIAAITVDDDLEADAASTKKLLEALAAKSPYLVKPKTPETVDYRTAGIGGVGSSAKPDPGPGTPRMASAYEASARK